MICTQELKDSSIKSTERIRVRVVPTEVYSRVVGYYRPVQNWNEGKVEEFEHRRFFSEEGAGQGVCD